MKVEQLGWCSKHVGEEHQHGRGFMKQATNNNKGDVFLLNRFLLFKYLLLQSNIRFSSSG